LPDQSGEGVAVDERQIGAGPARIDGAGVVRPQQPSVGAARQNRRAPARIFDRDLHGGFAVAGIFVAPPFPEQTPVGGVTTDEHLNRPLEATGVFLGTRGDAQAGGAIEPRQ
jgi:hypothetical protein